MDAQSSLITARVDNDIKSQGNLALQRAGYTPSLAIQTMWQYASSCSDKPDELAKMLDSLRGTSDDEAAKASKLEASRRAVDSLTALRKRLGTTDVHVEERPWRELRDMELQERLGVEL